jgi:predicted RNase H-like HicB family nuclease
MPIDLTRGVHIRVEGEVGRFNTLPVESLVKLAENLQDLLQTIARYLLDVDGAIDLENFHVELSDFRAGSAIPGFVFTPRVKTVTSGDVFEQRRFVNDRFDELMQIADSGNYTQIKTLAPQSHTRNRLVESLYEFTNTLGNSPVSIVDIENGEIKPLYKIYRLKREMRDQLMTKMNEPVAEKEEFEVVARVRMVRRGGKVRSSIKDTFETNHGEPGYTTDVIVHENFSYLLHYPLRCRLEKEEDFYVIESEMLDVIGTGKTIDEAEKQFSSGFHHVFQRYQDLPYGQMSDRNKRIKTVLLTLVDKIQN